MSPRTERRRAGFTLLELLIAVAMSAAVLIGIAGLSLPLVRSQVTASTALTAQLGSAAALAQIERTLRQATYLVKPAVAAAPASSLEGCSNAAVFPGSASPTFIDPAQPVTGFAFCSADHALWYYSGGACPLPYACGGPGGFVLAGVPGGSPNATATFLRPSAASSLVRASISVQSGAVTSSAETSVSMAFAAGRNQ